MNRLLVPSILAAGLCLGCGTETPDNSPLSTPNSSTTHRAGEELELTVEHPAYPWKPSREDNKGSGDLGTAYRQLAIGEKIVASCMIDDGDIDTIDAVRISEGEFAGYDVSVILYLADPKSPPNTSIRVFTLNPEEIKARLGFCATNKD